MAEARWPAQLAAPTAPADVETRMRCTFAHLNDTETVARDRGTHTGAVNLLELTANRARREFTGGFYNDVTLTLNRLDTEIDSLRGALELSLVRGCA